MTITDMKDEILQAIEAQRIVIIKGATGCGKTTQIPRMIYESAPTKTNIVVTQPRRIAAISIAKRVASEMDVPLGNIVGFQVGLDKKATEVTRILYVTTGVLLEKLIKARDMREFTHYIIDEIHEREQDMDFVLIVVRKFLNTSWKEAKLILMSATMDTSKFKRYLVSYYNQMEFEPRVLEIEEPSPFPIFEFYLNDVYRNKPAIFKGTKLIPFTPDGPVITEDVYNTAARIIQELDNVDAPVEGGTPQGKPAVLVFLPGLHEIETFEKTLVELSSDKSTPLWIRPLHSSITTDEQQEVFKNPPKPTMRKVILSTNIAESSVTVTDIKYVIDFCLTKCLVIDRNTGFSSLELAWASRNSLTQRAGRVGRTSSGQVYRLISKEFYKRELNEEVIPEILRCPLESLILKAKLLDLGPPKKILAEAMDPPDLGNIQQAVANLKEIGALLINTGDEYDPSNGDITLMGKVLAYLPVDVRLGKLIYLGNVFGVSEECIIIACSLATKNLFSTPYGKTLEAYDKKLWWANSTCSDCFAYLNAYNAWRKQTYEGNFNSWRKERDWVRTRFLQLNALRELATMENDVRRRLVHSNIFSFEREASNPETRKHTSENERRFFIKLAIAAAFYPNYFTRGCQSGRNEEKTAIETLGGHDPFSSVYFLGLPLNQETKIYKGAVKKLFERMTDRLDVNVDNGSKAYVTFRQPLSRREDRAIPGKVEMAVYRAVKMRYAGLKFSVPHVSDGEALRIYNEYLRQNKCAEDYEFRKKIDKLTWPWRKDDNKSAKDKLEVKISYVQSPGRFWIQNAIKSASATLIELTKVLNYDESILIQLPQDANLAVGSMYVANDGENDGFHRCRIVSKKLEKVKFTKEYYSYSVHFIDYGNSCVVSGNELYDVLPEVKQNFFIDKLPDLAVECSLVKMQPICNEIVDEFSQAEWTTRACNFLRSIESVPTYAKVYSVVNDVLRVKIVYPNLKDEPYKFENTINYNLIAKGYALKTEEDYRSLISREELKRFKQMQERMGLDKHTTTNVVDNVTFYDVDLPRHGQIFLNGPYSPLEMTLSSMTRTTTGKPVNVERNSVNSVLLNTNPSDPRDRMLVAAYVGVNPAGTRLNLMHTTLMPNIPALPMLCCLLFSPMVELRCNPTFTRYCGAICGLGYDKYGKSLYPANDVEVAFDHEISEKDLELINRIRYWLNVAVNPLKTDENSKKYLVENTREELFNCTSYLRKYFRTLFFENKYQLQEPVFSANEYHWALNSYSRLRDPRPEAGIKRHPTDDRSSAYSLIWGLWRTGNIEKETQAMLKNLNSLALFSENRLPGRDSIDCDLCQVLLENPTYARTHLKEPEHRMRSKRYLNLPDDMP